MASSQSLGHTLSELLQSQDVKDEVKDWKLLGQEQDRSLLISCNLTLAISGSKTANQQTWLARFHRENNTLQILYKFQNITNVIQATINSNHSLLVYVIKEKVLEVTNRDSRQSAWIEVYKAFMLEVNATPPQVPRDLGFERSRQIMTQFLYRKKEGTGTQKFLILIHQESISLNHVQLTLNANSDWVTDGNFSAESVVRAFTWAQWNPVSQSLYYIHYRKPQVGVEGEEPGGELSPTLSCLQFHDDLPHETVLNIPLNLPQLLANPCSVYEDDPIPLRCHDCSLDLQVVSDMRGLAAICHHYLYQPVKANLTATTVHFAYSVTLLHHGVVIHCVVPGIPWADARHMKPTFALHGDQHMIVYAPGLFTHLLDMGLSHEPCCHIMMDSDVSPHASHLAPLLQPGNAAAALTVDLHTLQLVPLSVTPAHLVATFKNHAALSNRLAVLHYFLVHKADMEVVGELLSIIAEQPVNLDIPQLLQEVLIGGAFSLAQKNLTQDTATLVALLPLTTCCTTELEVNINRVNISLTQETLWNTAMMLLSPQQRLVPYRVDMWTRLWDQLAKRTGKPRFGPSLVADKLMVSLVCYQPEALSRSSTPLSPGASLVGSGTLADLAAISSRKPISDSLPFYEMESCTASKQEHVISVNLRELSMHLLKNSHKQTPIHVHAVATRYVASQLEMSKHLCQLLCHCAAVDPRQEHERGFSLVDQLDESRRYVLFRLLERYYFAVDSLAFPLPQGFTSFYTYLGYRALSFSMFLQYVQRNVFELQVDVMKVIMADTEDTREGVNKKLRLLLLLPRSRAKRLLNQWTHPVSLMLRAREHAVNILSGMEGNRARAHPQQKARTAQLMATRGLAAFPSADRLSPLDTFLDLLTAKANLSDLDFGLLIEATITSTEDFLN